MDAVYLDFAEAFDTVLHERLLVKLASYGIQGSHSTVTDGTFRRHVDLRIAPCTDVNIYIISIINSF